MDRYFKKHLLGQVFVHIHPHRAPTALQITGWSTTAGDTPTRFIYVRKLKVTTLSKGLARIDRSDVKAVRNIQRRLKNGTFQLQYDDCDAFSRHPYLSKGKDEKHYLKVCKDTELDLSYLWNV
jgi:hypothetical protein